ncbi:XK2 [Symbiodinium sp. CCMP2592]|nr:XK2 [Symbiodinium sp. CCMP2592]
MTLYLGFDSSTQSLKATAVRAADLQVFKRYVVNFDTELPHFRTSGGMTPSDIPARVTSPVLMWIEAWDLLLSKMKSDSFPFVEVVATSGSGQQHGSVYWAQGASRVLAELDPDQALAPQLNGAFARMESPIWADSSTGAQCARIEAAVGRQTLAKATGSRAYERFTGMQIAKLIEEEPAMYAKCEHISLVSSAMCSLFLGAYAPVDTSDGSGTNLNNLQELGGLTWYDPALAAAAPGGAAGLRARLGPGLCESHRALGSVAPYFVKRYGFSATCLVVAWSGDNPCSLAGLGLQAPGDVAVSMGTSDTMFAMMASASPGEDGMVLRNPVDPNSYMGMLVFKNGSLAREQVLKTVCGGQWETWAKMLAETQPGNGGSIGFYFHSPEITPTTGDQSGVFRFDGEEKEVGSFAPSTEVRAVVEGKFLAMRAFAQGIGMDPTEVKRIIATGGASSNKAILQVLADVFGVPVFTLDQSDSASLGAALRAGHGLRCLSSEGGFLSFAKFLAGGSIDYKLAAQPAAGAKEVYTKLLPRFLKLQEKVLSSLGHGSAKRQRT